MRCIRCNKSLKAFARQVADGDGQVFGWRPRCAELAFGAKARQPAGKVQAKARRTTGAEPGRSEFQIDWIEQVAA